VDATPQPTKAQLDAAGPLDDVIEMRDRLLRLASNLPTTIPNSAYWTLTAASDALTAAAAILRSAR
jgi:hypothetical protein